MFDVVIIGAGVSGAAAARELSRYKLDVLVLEKEEDVCCGTSKANSAIVHAGFDAEPGSNMAKYNVPGNKMMKALSEELDFSYINNGSIVVCYSEDDVKRLEELKERGRINGVEGLRIIDRDELKKMEPNISDEPFAALYAPSGGIVCPFGMNIALAENAFTNGVSFKFNTEVEKVERDGEYYIVKAGGEEYRTRTLINAAGVYADVFNNMVSERKLHITPRRGSYCLLDRAAGSHVRSTIFSLPDKVYGKGVLVSPTVHGNLLLGPTARDIDEREGTKTTASELDELIQKAGRNVSGLPMRQVITSFAGLRAHEDGHDFIIGEAEDAKGFFNCAGIESPGLTSAPAIGIELAERIAGMLKAELNPDFNPKRKGVLNPAGLSLEERNELIKKEPAYGNIICRCETVSEGEIIDAIRRPLGARSLDGVKRRTRAGMGRCQAGFCSPRTMEILARELNLNISDISKSGGESKLIIGKDKEDIE